jgi:hypothetical protein
LLLKLALIALGIAAPTLAILEHRSSGAQTVVNFADVTDSAGIHFRHTSTPEKKFIVESMSGGVALFDYDNDNLLDIYFTNSLTVETAANPRGSSSALYHNAGDGTFKDVTDRSGMQFPGWAMGVVAGDYDGDGQKGEFH